MASLDITSPTKQPRCVTLECYLICISPYFILSLSFFFSLNLEAKSIDSVLSYSHQSEYFGYYPQTNHIYLKNLHLTVFQSY